jgi:hypothetical protein
MEDLLLLILGGVIILIVLFKIQNGGVDTLATLLFLVSGIVVESQTELSILENLFYCSLVYLVIIFWFIPNFIKNERLEEPEIEDERVLSEKDEREENKWEELEESYLQPSLRGVGLLKKTSLNLREKELEPLRKEKEFWIQLNGLDAENIFLFKKELNKVFEKLGFETELTPPSNDEDIDHILNGEIVVQTKHQKRKVSRPDLQKFWGSWKDSHEKGIFVSIHGFTRTCKDFIKDKPILLYDVDDVIGMSEGKKPEWNE